MGHPSQAAAALLVLHLRTINHHVSDAVGRADLRSSRLGSSGLLLAHWPSMPLQPSVDSGSITSGVSASAL